MNDIKTVNKVKQVKKNAFLLETDTVIDARRIISEYAKQSDLLVLTFR